MDDAVIAGTEDAVLWFCSALRAELSQAGLVLNTGKCVVTPSAGTLTTARPTTFPGWVWNTSGSCKVLGAAVGQGPAHLDRIARRRGKASKLLARIGELSDGQAGLLLLRNCASYAKLMYNIRTSPAQDIVSELDKFH